MHLEASDEGAQSSAELHELVGLVDCAWKEETAVLVLAGHFKSSPDSGDLALPGLEEAVCQPLHLCLNNWTLGIRLQCLQTEVWTKNAFLNIVCL